MVYLDTSAAVPLFVQEPASDRVAAWFATCADPIVSADWMVTEFASALSIKERRGAMHSVDSLHLAVALEIGASSMATADANLDVNAKSKGLKKIRL